MMKNFRTYEIAKELYNECQSLKVKRHMKDQLDRASLSIVLNLAEGCGKKTPKDKARFYSIALGSLRETTAILELSNNQFLLKLCDKLGAHIYKLIRNPGL